MSRETPTRLELHRLKFHQAGGKGSLLTLSDLTPDDMELISAAVFSLAAQEKGERKPNDLFAQVLREHGVMCPHPEEPASATSRWFVCPFCKATVIDPARVWVQNQVRSRKREAP